MSGLIDLASLDDAALAAIGAGGGGGGSGSGLPSTFTARTTTYTAAAGDFVEGDATSAGFTVTLPTAPAVGALVVVRKVDASANVVTVAPAGGGTIDGDANATIITQWAGAVFEHKASNVWRIVGVTQTASSSGGGAQFTSILGKSSGTVTGSDVTADATVAAALTAKLAAASNLSDLASAATARTNLGLGTAATISATAGGDLSGTLPSPTVAKVNGVTVTGTPANGNVLTASSSTAASWQAPAGGATDKLGLTPTAVKTANYTAAAGDFVPVDTTSGNVTITFPTAPADGSVVGVKHVTRGGTNTVGLALGGSDKFNTATGSTTGTLTLANQGILAQYKATGAIWYIVADDLPLSGLDARYAQTANNLSDLASAGTARTNLGLAAVAASGSATDLTTGTVPAARFGATTIPVSAVNATGTASSTTYLRGDGTWNTPAGGGGSLYPVFGDGSDGSATISGTTTPTRDMFYQDLTITSTGILKSAYRVWVKGTLTIQAGGNINNDGVIGSGIGGAGGAVGGYFGGGVGGNATTGAGGNGANPGAGYWAGPSGTGTGGNGGGGASGAAGTGAAASAASYASQSSGNGLVGFPVSFTAITINRFASAIVPCGGGGGGSGGGDGTNKGGNGSGGGGVVHINARAIVNNGTISANGGPGQAGAAGNVGGGGGGAGGIVIVNAVTYTGSGVVTANGGAAGAAFGTGSAGSAGQAGYVVQNIWS